MRKSRQEGNRYADRSEDMRIKWIMAIAVWVFIGWIAYSYKAEFVAWIHTGSVPAIVASISFIVLLVFVPVTPFIVIAALNGAVFGPWLGTFINWSGGMIGSVLMFLLSRYVFQDWAQNKIRQYPQADRIKHIVENNAFLAILLVRLIPVVPSQAVNLLTGVGNIRLMTFFIASGLGKLPAMLIYSVVGNQFANNRWVSIGTVVVYMIFISLAGIWIQRKYMTEETSES